MNEPELSVVVPLYNESEVLERFVHELAPVLESLGATYEVIFVDDGSTDESLDVLSRVNWPQARIVCLQRNVGHQVALDAGMKESKGLWVVTLDADLQHPPTLISEMFEVGNTENVDVVYAVRRVRAGDRFFKRFCANFYYALMNRITTATIEKNAADFRLLSRHAVDVLNAIPGYKVFRLLLPHLGFPHEIVLYNADSRYAGTSKYTLSKMFNLGILSMVSFSSWPLKFVALVGLVTSAFALTWLVFVGIFFLLGNTIEGWASVASMVLLVGGMQLLGLGVFGLYLSKIYEGSQGRPMFVVRARVSLKPDATSLQLPPEKETK